MAFADETGDQTLARVQVGEIVLDAYLEQNNSEAQKQFRKAIELSPEWFPTYRDLAYVIRAIEGDDAAVGLLKNFIEKYGDDTSSDYARQEIVKFRTGG